MGSSAQVIVGCVLLVTAFLFGRYINEQPLVPGQAASAVSELVKSDLPLKPIQASSVPKPFPFSLAKKEKPAPPTPEPVVIPEPVETAVVQRDPSTLQRTLRDRILGERQNRRNEPAATQGSVANGFRGGFSTPDTFLDQPVAVPDFSHLENSIVADQLPERNKFVPIEVPSFESLANENKIGLADVPFNDTRDVIVGPMSSLADDTMSYDRFDSGYGQFQTMPPRQTQRSISDSATNRRQSSPMPRQFQQSRNDLPKKQIRQPRQQQRSTSRGSFGQTDQELVPVRHRESRLTTEVTEFVDYTTVFGDTLHGLSSRFFGKPDYYLDIYLANKDAFENPAKVPVNTQLRIPVMSKLINRR